jgi:hypothetical protein
MPPFWMKKSRAGVQGAGKSAGLICVAGALPLGTGWRVTVQRVYSVGVVTKARGLLKRQ